MGPDGGQPAQEGVPRRSSLNRPPPPVRLLQIPKVVRTVGVPGSVVPWLVWPDKVHDRRIGRGFADLLVAIGEVAPRELPDPGHGVPPGMQVKPLIVKDAVECVLVRPDKSMTPGEV